MAHLPIGVSGQVLTVNSDFDTCVAWTDNDGLFGSQYHYIHDTTVLSSTSNNYIERTTLSVSGIPDGTYYIGWEYTFVLDKDYKGGEVRVQLDNTTTLHEHVRSRGHSDVKGYENSGDSVCGFTKISFLV